MKIRITEAQLKRIVSASVVNEAWYGEVDTTHGALQEIKKYVEGAIDYLYNEGVIAYDDEHLNAMANDMSLVDFKDICKTTLWYADGQMSELAKGEIQRYLETGSYPELEDTILSAIREYRDPAGSYRSF